MPLGRVRQAGPVRGFVRLWPVCYICRAPWRRWLRTAAGGGPQRPSSGDEMGGWGKRVRGSPAGKREPLSYCCCSCFPCWVRAHTHARAPHLLCPRSPCRKGWYRACKGGFSLFSFTLVTQFRSPLPFLPMVESGGRAKSCGRCGLEPAPEMDKGAGQGNKSRRVKLPPD